jgi:hypothetical protein
VIPSGNTSHALAARPDLPQYKNTQKIIHTIIRLTGQEVLDELDSIDVNPYVDALPQPPFITQDITDIKTGIANGDPDKVKAALDGKGPPPTEAEKDTLIGLAQVRDAVKNGKPIPGSVIDKLGKDTTGLVKPGLISSLKTLKTLQKIDWIFRAAIDILTGGGSLGGMGTGFPTGTVPIVPVPGVPFGVVFPLGGGVWGMGTDGLSSAPPIGIYQGYLPQPPVYSGSAAVADTAAGAAPAVIENSTDKTIEYYWNNSNRIQKIPANSWSSFGDVGSATGIRIRKAGTQKWEKFDFTAGAYSVVDSVDNSITLEPAPTKITFSSPGNPIPFKLYVDGTKFTIEPGKPLELKKTDGGNGVMQIRFARSPDKEDVAEHIVGGTQSFEIGVDKSTGKFKLFPGGTTQVEPPEPKQNVTVASSMIAYDDTKITSANVSDLPVLPDYD